MKLKQPLTSRLVIAFFTLLLATLAGSILGSMLTDHSLIRSWGSFGAVGKEIGRAFLVLPYLWLGVVRVTRGTGLLFGELTCIFYLSTGRGRHLLLAAGLQLLKFIIFSSLTISVGTFF
jgi:hypothetical protein